MIISKIRDRSATNIEPTIFNVEGIEVHAYGILHGIGGGADHCYVDAVNRAIDNAPGARYCEKSMKKMYKGLEYDVSDWLVFRPIDAFKFAACSFSKPSFVYNFMKTSFAEKLMMRRRFGENTIYSMCDAPSSVAFHGLSAYERRELRGLPSPEEYLKLNIMRWEKGVKRRFRFADKDWIWLEDIEPNACIPLRSIHMLEYLLNHAKANGHKTASVFCGDIHSSDMDWYSTIRENKEHFSFQYAEAIRHVVNQAINNKRYKAMRTLVYYASLSVGAIVAVAPYMALSLGLLYANGYLLMPHWIIGLIGKWHEYSSAWLA